MPPANGKPVALHHAYTLRYFVLKFVAVALRSLIAPAIWLGVNVVRRHGVAGVTQRTIYIPSRDRGRFIVAHLYEKKDGAGRSKNVAAPKKPVVLNWHGSGFVVPGLGGDDAFCAQMASQLNCYVVDCQYRKAPEYPFPNGVQDAEDVARWVFTQGNQFDLNRVSLNGFSAGGNFALATAWTLGPEKISSVTAFYPPTFFTISPGGKKAPGAGAPPAVMNRLFKFFDESYIVDQSQRKDPRLSVLLAPAERYPDTVLLICGDRDTLYNDSQKLVNKLKEETGHSDATFVGVPGKKHAFDKDHSADGKATAHKYYVEAGDAIARSWKRRESKL